MPTMFALYVPRIHELIVRLIELSLAWAVLAGCARWLRLGKVVPPALMLAGCVVALLPGVISASSEDLGRYGDICREWNNSQLSDGFFAIVAYFEVGWGSIVGLAGMAVPLLLLAFITKLRALVRRERQSPSPA